MDNLNNPKVAELLSKLGTNPIEAMGKLIEFSQLIPVIKQTGFSFLEDYEKTLNIKENQKALYSFAPFFSNELLPLQEGETEQKINHAKSDLAIFVMIVEENEKGQTVIVEEKEEPVMIFEKVDGFISLLPRTKQTTNLKKLE